MEERREEGAPSGRPHQLHECSAPNVLGQCGAVLVAAAEQMYRILVGPPPPPPRFCNPPPAAAPPGAMPHLGGTYLSDQGCIAARRGAWRPLRGSRAGCMLPLLQPSACTQTVSQLAQAAKLCIAPREVQGRLKPPQIRACCACAVRAASTCCSLFSSVCAPTSQSVAATGWVASRCCAPDAN